MLSMNPTSSPSIQELLASIVFPISKAELLDHLRMNGATDTLLAPVEQCTDSKFAAPQDVMDCIQNS